VVLAGSLQLSSAVPVPMPVPMPMPSTSTVLCASSSDVSCWGSRPFARGRSSGSGSGAAGGGGDGGFRLIGCEERRFAAEGGELAVVRRLCSRR